MGVETDHLISARIPALVFFNKKKKNEEDLQFCGFCHSIGQQSENKRKRKEKLSIWTLPENLKSCGMTVMVLQIVVGTYEMGPTSLEKGIEKLEITGRIKTN